MGAESERLQRYVDNRCGYSEEELGEADESLCNKLRVLLGHPEIGEDELVDAYYYDFSVIPDEIIESKELYRDAYLIYGITKKGEIVSKWVDRDDVERFD